MKRKMSTDEDGKTRLLDVAKQQRPKETFNDDDRKSILETLFVTDVLHLQPTWTLNSAACCLTIEEGRSVSQRYSVLLNRIKQLPKKYPWPLIQWQFHPRRDAIHLLFYTDTPASTSIQLPLQISQGCKVPIDHYKDLFRGALSAELKLSDPDKLRLSTIVPALYNFQGESTSPTMDIHIAEELSNNSLNCRPDGDRLFRIRCTGMRDLNTIQLGLLWKVFPFEIDDFIIHTASHASASTDTVQAVNLDVMVHSTNHKSTYIYCPAGFDTVNPDHFPSSLNLQTSLNRASAPLADDVMILDTPELNSNKRAKTTDVKRS